MPICCVVGCSKRPGRDKGVRFFGIPTAITRECEKTAELSARRRALWIARINRKDLRDQDVKKHTRVCSEHFISGQPSKLFDDCDPDWAPSINLGYCKAANDSCMPPPIHSAKRVKTKILKSSEGPDMDMEFEAANVGGPNGGESINVTPVSDLCVVCIADEDSEEKQLQTDSWNSNTESKSASKCVDFSCQTEESVHSKTLLSLIDVACQTDLTAAQINDTAQQLQCAMSDNLALRGDVHNLTDRLKAQSLTEDVLREDNEKVKFYTALPNFAALDQVFQSVEKKVPYNTNNVLPKFQEFVMCLMVLRVNASVQDLAFRFGVHRTTISRFFDKWVTALSHGLENVITWPERATLQAAMPKNFQKEFGEAVAVIVEILEIAIERQSSPLPGSQNKQLNTMKILIGMTPQGKICFVSKACDGSTSDVYLTEQSGILEHLLPGDLILADRGFCSGDEAYCCAKLYMSAFTEGKPHLFFNDGETMSKLANSKIHVQRVLGRMRQKFLCLSGTLPITYMSCKQNDPLSTVDHIVRVCCAIANLCAQSSPTTAVD